MIYVHNGMFDVFYVCFSKVIRHFIHVYHTLMVQLFIFYFVGRYTSSGSVLSSFTFILQEGIPAVDQFLVHLPLFCRKVYQQWISSQFIFLYFVGRYTSSGSVLSSFSFILQEGIPAVDQFLAHFPLFCRKVYQQWISSQLVFYIDGMEMTFGFAFSD